MVSVLVHGVTGFTGALVSRELARRGVPHAVAGRRREAVLAHAREVGAEARVFDLDDPAAVRRGLAGFGAVLNCAGPFRKTAPTLASAAIEASIAYLDLAGEVDEHEALRARDDEARAAGSMLLPGVGFGVVPTDCAAALAARALARPTRLLIAYETVGGVSRGTLETVLRGIHTPGAQRRGGALVACRPGERALELELELGRGAVTVVTNPWRADLVSAWVSTGIPEIETFATFPFAARMMMRLPGLMRRPFVQRLLDRMIAGAPAGPTKEELERGSTRVLVVAEDADGGRAEVRVRGPEAYVFTARAAAEIVARVASGGAIPGFQTPSRAFGPELLRSIEGVEITS
jgi:short subunit dehydrogenase-like uncharacterized protein